MSSKEGSSQNSNQSTDKVLSIIEVLAQVAAPMRLQDLAKALNYNTTTVLRFITTLVHRGYVIQDEITSKYSLTYKLSRIMNQFNARNNPFEHIHPYLERIAHTLNETATVAIEQDQMVVYIDVVQAKERKMYLLQHVGSIAPLYCTSAGKLFLTKRSDDELDEYFATGKFQKYTPVTITAKAQLIKEMQKIRELGYAVDNEEYEIGTRSLAVPVYNDSAQIKASISVTGPAQRLSDKVIQENLPMLFTMAYMASTYLGYIPAEKSSQK